jgi:uncharacterized protein
LSRYKRSRYTVLSPNQYRMGNRDYRLVYVTTGPFLLAIPSFVIDCMIKDRVDALPREVISRLLSRHVLVDSDEPEVKDELKHIEDASKDKSHRIFALMPTSLCNMHCSYCGQVTCPLHFDGRVSAGVDARVLAAIENPKTRYVEVRWYGGEPMMAYHRILASSGRYVSSADRQHVRYWSSMSTNGSLMTVDRLQALYDEARLRNVTVTVDGYGDCHNRSRLMRSGRPTYDFIMNWLQRIAGKQSDFTQLLVNIRINITAANAPSISQLFDDMSARGMNEDNFNIQLIPVYDWGQDNSAMKLSKATLDRLMPQLIRQALHLGLHTGVFPSARRDVACIAVNQQAELIDSRGNLYSCTEFPLVKPYEENDILANVLNLNSAALRPMGRYDGWIGRLEDASVACSRCTFLPVCGGACPKRWQESIHPCPPFTRQLSERFNIAAEQWGMTSITDPSDDQKSLKS